MLRTRFLVVLCSASVAAAQTDPLSLDDAIRLAWDNDPTVAALALTPQLAEAREVQAGIRPNPQIEIGGALPMDDASEWSLGVGLRQRMIPAERLELARALARVGGESTVLHLREQRRAVAGLVRELVYHLAVAETRREWAERAAESPREWLAVIERRHAAGEIAGADLDVLRLDFARAEQALALAEAESAAASERLRARLRLPVDAAVAVATDLAALLARPLPSTQPAVSELSHPRLALAALEIRETEAALSLARSESRGDWTVGAGLDFERRANDATGRLENEPSVNVSASVPWMRRVPNRGDVLARQAQVRIAEARLAGLREELTMQIDSAWASVRQLQPVVQRFDRLIDEAAALPTRLRAAYERGEVSAFDLIRVREQQLALQADFLTAAARYVDELAAAETAAGFMPAQP